VFLLNSRELNVKLTFLSRLNGGELVSFDNQFFIGDIMQEGTLDHSVGRGVAGKTFQI